MGRYSKDIRDKGQCTPIPAEMVAKRVKENEVTIGACDENREADAGEVLESRLTHEL